MKISESAISNTSVINELKQAGFNGFLIGENFMKEENPGEAMKEFVKGYGKIAKKLSSFPRLELFG